METIPMICRVNQWTGFYMITASVMKGLNAFSTGDGKCVSQVLIFA